MNKQRNSAVFIWSVIVLGMASLLMSLIRLPIGRIDVYLVFLSAFTIALASRVTIKIPKLKSHIAVADTFVFLTLLLYGGEFAVILSAVEAFVSSQRFCRKRLTVWFNAAAMAISTTLVVSALQLFGLVSHELHGDPDNRPNFIIALSVIALTQFLCNTWLAALYDSLKNALPLWDTWKSKYIWTFFSYFVGAGAAGVIVQLSDSLGLGIIFATFPVIFFVFLSYRMYMKNVEMSMQQAEQAEQYAKILESKSVALTESEERFRSAFDYAPIGIGLLSPAGPWIKVNKALTEILGYSEAEFLAMDFQSVIHPDDLGVTLIKVHELLSGKIANCQMEQRYVHRSGATVWASWSVSMATETAAKQPNLIFQIQDVTSKKLTEQRLQHDATHDALTGLPNRAFFMGRLSSALEKVREVPGYRASILFIDLDRFKYVNDSLGHVIGDQLLRGIAERLSECMRPSDIVARLGGDEFTILVEGLYDVNEVTRIAERIQVKFGMPFNLGGHEIFSSASIGILHASDQHFSSEDMMRDADTAMYQAKRAGTARHEIFDEKMHREAREILRLETDLRRAIERQEISVYYQPICRLETRGIEGVEALARWHHPELGDIPPGKFIPLAEEIGLIDRLCEHVLRRACCDIGLLKQDLGADVPLSMSVNLSCKQFAGAALIGNIEGILKETGFPASALKLEITESVFFEHHERAVEMLNNLRMLGIAIDVDDFGTGYSNLGYLMKLPISNLKIDRSFISMMDSAGENDEIVRAIVLLARNLGLKVIAEGLETEYQYEQLMRLECESGQGYLFASPMTFEQVREFINDQCPGMLRRPTSDVPTISLVQ